MTLQLCTCHLHLVFLLSHIGRILGVSCVGDDLKQCIVGFLLMHGLACFGQYLLG